MKFLPILLLIISAIPAGAATYTVEGIVSVQDGEKNLIVGQRSYRIFAENYKTIKDLTRVEAGDYIFALGEINYRKKTVELQSIEKVGLKRLLGHWKSDQRGVFAFDSFNRLTLYTSSFTATDDQLVSFRSTQHLRYHINPSAGSTWTIFIVGAEDLLIGRFVISGERVRMIFIDQTTGAITDRLKLTKLQTALP